MLGRPWLAKLYAKANIEDDQLQPPKLYIGLAFILASDIRQHGSTVVDTRAEYLGHADVRHGVIQRRGEALPPDIAKTLRQRLKQIADAATFVEDENPNSMRWTSGLPGRDAPKR